MCSIPATRTENKLNIISGSNIRRLTSIECARLQGFPDTWHEGVSESHAYKCYGNAVSVPIVKLIAEKLIDNNK